MRRMRAGFGSAVVIAVTLGLAAEVLANGVGGPPLAHTGAPGENNCTRCHTGTFLNGGAGEISIEGPLGYEPGVTYELEVRIVDPTAVGWGVELTVLDADSDSAVGTLVATASNTDVRSSGVREYLAHTLPGSGGQTFAWLFNWTAPNEDVGDVIFYAAGNASNGFSAFDGKDQIYTSSTLVEFVPEPGSGLALLTVLASLCWIRRRAA